MLDKYNYFKISEKKSELSISFAEYIKDVIYDETSTIIPFTNGKCYLLYQDISFKILKALKTLGITAEIRIEDNVSPIIHISTSTEAKLQARQDIIDIITPIINNSINRKFSLI